MMGWEWKFVSKADQLLKATNRATRKWLHRVGGYARKVARNSLKVAKPKRSDNELTDRELDRWVSLNQFRERHGLEVPAPFPDRVSKPGNPPLLHDRSSPLKRLLSYHVDEDAKETLIGPERAKKGIAHVLEHGGGRRLPRPFMGPSKEKTEPHMARWWQDAIVA